MKELTITLASPFPVWLASKLLDPMALFEGKLPKVIEEDNALRGRFFKSIGYTLIHW